ncbi:MAG TPA: hypothetical protein ENK31_01205 [Nannocystis exedens]|nr:hypothetical protein [Nannocystis exedens]
MSRATNSAAAALRHSFAGLLVILFSAVIFVVSLIDLRGIEAAGPYSGFPSAIVLAGLAGTACLLTIATLRRASIFGGLAPLAVLGLCMLAGVVAAADLFGLTGNASESLIQFLGLAQVVAALLFVSPGIRQGHWRAIRQRLPASWANAVFTAAALAIGIGGASALLHQGARGRPLVVSELPAILDLPPASVLFGAAEPTVVAAYFLDLTCDDCRSEFRRVTSEIREFPLSESLQLRFYHYPRVKGGCTTQDGERVQLRLDQGACLGAAAVECVELLAPGLGIRMAGELFDLQRQPQPVITTGAVLRAAHELGLQIDVNNPANSLSRCITGNRAIHEGILSHIEFVRRHGVDETPHGFFVGVRDGRLDPEHVETFRGALSPKIRARKIASVSQRSAPRTADPRP